MNQQYTWAIVALFIGVCLGMLIMAIMLASGRGASEDRRAPNPDTLLLDFLEKAEVNLFFNDQVSGSGMWGILDGENKLVAAAPTLRSAIDRACMREYNEQMGIIQRPEPAPTAADSQPSEPSLPNAQAMLHAAG